MATNWSPDPKVLGLLNALRKAEQRHATMTRNQKLGRDENGRSPLFPSTIPGNRGAMSPLGGQAKPEPKPRS
jgi:hypothetical protein